MRQIALCLALMFALYAAAAKSQPANSVGQNLPATYVPSGKVLYQLYCATCHGADAKGNGPLALALKTPPPNLTTLAKRHAGKFPTDYVTRMLRFGTTSRTHGSSEMPAWGPIFQYFDKSSQAAARKRIDNLCDYLSSIQQ
jgi:mono/diheme cytochrome c family protein